MKNDAITPEQVDALLHFLPRFDVPARDFVQEWRGGEETETGAITMPYPVYHPDVAEFYHLAGQPCWSDYDYNPRQAFEMLEDDEFISQASIQDIKTMLTYCVRGERFSDGHWAAMLESGRVVAILKRLEALRRSMTGGQP